MSMSDPIADMLARIRNAQAVQKASVSMPSSTVKVGIAEVLKSEGFIADFKVVGEGAKKDLEVALRYVDGQGVIENMKRYSRPGLRQYRGKNDLPKVLDGLGIAIVSTSHGIMTDHSAREAGHGGEILCFVS